MCFNLILKDLIKSINTCKLKTQLMVCYVSGIFVVMLGLIVVLYISLTTLQNSTVREIEHTLHSTATDDVIEFVTEYSNTLSNQLNSIGMISSYLTLYLQNFQKNTTALKLPYITEYKSLPRDCTVTLASYDNKQVCMNYSSVHYFSEGSSKEYTKYLGYLAYVFPDIFNLLSPVLHRILIYVPEERSLVVFPGQSIPENYNISNEPWVYTNITNNNFTFTTLYDDSLNSNKKVISLVQNLFVPDAFNFSNNLPRLNLEIQETALYELFSSSGFFMQNELKLISNNNGQILSDGLNNTFSEYKTVEQLNKKLWESAKKCDFDENHFILYKEDCFFRVSIQSVPLDSAHSDDVWLYVFLFVKENSVMKYKNETQDTLDSLMYLLLGLTSGIVLVIVGISAVIINLTGKSVSKPLESIKSLTDRIYSGEVDIKRELENELKNIEEGTEQVADLVIAFRSLVNTISHRRDTEMPKKGKNKIYPPNELFGTGRITWKDMLKEN